ncbi:hypothetical protein SAMN04487819_1323 [Actinopolyspora alba]|uniref:Uncharacterized protein n=1 Tax=Actinopolyspora alba TaxID=673379 RepID=A0A1I2CPE2_9ACTN|nr:hypothetical protein [Actinopolyspora alba]SFE70128.1 hypothetical protein SAMN04487819_1323 [Actinopolyspora alba]
MGNQQQRDALEAAIRDAWLAGDWDTATEKAEELTKFDKATGMEFARISREHKNKRAPGPIRQTGRAS